MAAVIWGTEVEPKVDSLIQADGWRFGKRLLAGDAFSTYRVETSDWQSGDTIAVEVEVTGRTFQSRNGWRAVRVKITFPGDGEPDVTCGGWMNV